MGVDLTVDLGLNVRNPILVYSKGLRISPDYEERFTRSGESIYRPCSGLVNPTTTKNPLCRIAIKSIAKTAPSLEPR